jgi:hypothetical protein
MFFLREVPLISQALKSMNKVSREMLPKDEVTDAFRKRDAVHLPHASLLPA